MASESVDSLSLRYGPAYRWLVTVTGMTGAMVMILSSPVPLFTEARPQVESAEEYFRALRAALNEVRDAGRGAALRSDFTFLVTEAAN